MILWDQGYLKKKKRLIHKFTDYKNKGVTRMGVEGEGR